MFSPTRILYFVYSLKDGSKVELSLPLSLWTTVALMSLKGERRVANVLHYTVLENILTGSSGLKVEVHYNVRYSKVPKDLFQKNRVINYLILNYTVCVSKAGYILMVIRNTCGF